MALRSYIDGRLKNYYQYYTGINYNPFPWPILTASSAQRLGGLAQAVLDARAEHPGASLADLYDANTMPVNLRRAYERLDIAVDRALSGGCLYQRSRTG